jgi:hypothetical protein
MPKATISANDTERFDLKSCPGGYVVLKPMPYDQYLHRRDIAMRFQMEGSASDKRGDDKVKMDMAQAQKAVAEFEFGLCIVDHNLEDDDGQKLQFPRDLKRLHPKVGEEIANLIDKMNTFEEELGN